MEEGAWNRIGRRVRDKVNARNETDGTKKVIYIKRDERNESKDEEYEDL